MSGQLTTVKYIIRFRTGHRMWGVQIEISLTTGMAIALEGHGQTTLISVRVRRGAALWGM